MISSNIQFIATDIDGTLLHSNDTLNERFFSLFRELREHGVLVAAASGRQYYSLRELFKPISDDLLFIAENGNYVRLRDEELLIRNVEPATVNALLAIARTIPNTYPILCGRNGAYIENNDPRFIEQLTKYYAKFTTVEALEDVTDDVILKVTICDLTDSETNSYPHFKHLENELKVKVSGNLWLDISNNAGHKGNAIKLVQETYGISPDATMVFGDYLNDLEMLQQAYFSFAMENAHPQVKATARFQAASNDADGVLQVLEEVLAAKKLAKEGLALL